MSCLPEDEWDFGVSISVTFQSQTSSVEKWEIRETKE